MVACGVLIATGELAQARPDTQTSIDPTRIMQGIITGIGFLGAGAMIRDSDYIKGAGSAASIWSAGVIGLVCGIGEIGIASMMTLIIFGVMILSALQFVADAPMTAFGTQHSRSQGAHRACTLNCFLVATNKNLLNRLETCTNPICAVIMSEFGIFYRNVCHFLFRFLYFCDPEI